jgi:hypothetical protein
VIHQTAIHAAAASVLRPASESPSASAKNAYNPSAARGPAASPSQRRRALADPTASPANGRGLPGTEIGPVPSARRFTPVEDFSR